MRAFAKVIIAGAVGVGSLLALAPAASADPPFPLPLYLCIDVFPDWADLPEICVPWPS